jgi:hypothetical protein
MNFPLLVTSAAPLLEAAGLHTLRPCADYSATGGWQLSACAFRDGNNPVVLVSIVNPATTEQELSDRITDALLELVPFTNTVQL